MNDSNIAKFSNFRYRQRSVQTFIFSWTTTGNIGQDSSISHDRPSSSSIEDDFGGDGLD